MKKQKRLTTLLVFSLVMAMLLQPAEILAATRKSCDSKPKSGNAFFMVKGTFLDESKESLLKRVNEIRKEACNEGVINPTTGKKLTKKDYVPIKWSADLEKVAQQRAAEAAIDQGHTRPNGESCFTVKYDGVQSWGEILAWNYSGMIEGINQWYEEKYDWVHKTGGVTGHYTQMIDPEHTYIGLGGFNPGDDWLCVAGEFMSDDTAAYMGLKNVDESKVGVSGTYYQVLEVPASNLKAKLDACTLEKGKTKKLKAKMIYTTRNIYGYEKKVNGFAYGKCKWSSSNKSVAVVSSDGTVTAKKKGTAEITVITACGKKATCKITVK